LCTNNFGEERGPDKRGEEKRREYICGYSKTI
jgi:hypothetical protein